MPRKARRKSTSGIYHIIMRGINRQMVFLTDEDRIVFIQTLERYRTVSGYSLFAYCLMGNHVHILLREGKEPLATVMRRICGSFVHWYNRKYDRIGHLFQDRYKSEPVENDAYFLTVLRYIFQNPLKAALVERIPDYPWSSYNNLVTAKTGDESLDFILSLFTGELTEAKSSLIQFLNQKSDDDCLEIEAKKGMNDDLAAATIQRLCNVKNPTSLRHFCADVRNMHLRALKDRGLTIRQLERLTGIKRGVIQKA